MGSSSNFFNTALWWEKTKAFFEPANLIKTAKNQAIILVLILLIIVIGNINSSFLSGRNLQNILMISSARIIIALGVGGILISRGTDLSAGRTVGLVAVIVASLMQRPDYLNRMYETLPSFMHVPYLSVIIAVLVGLIVGMLVGVFNGAIVAYLKVPPFIATLGSMVIIYGLSSLYIDRGEKGAQPIGGLRADFTHMGTGSWDAFLISIPYVIIFMIVVSVLYWIMLNKTTFGKNIYAIGGNPEAALVSGINVARNLIMVYAIGGAFYGLAGVLLAARTGGATNKYGEMYELDAIAACVIGGVSTAGGIGKVSGILTGVLIFEVLNNGLVILGVSPYWQQIIKGLIIILAVSIDIRKYLRKR